MKSLAENRPLLLVLAALAIGLSWKVSLWNLTLWPLVLWFAASRWRPLVIVSALTGFLLAPRPTEITRKFEPIELEGAVTSVTREFPNSTSFEMTDRFRYLVRYRGRINLDLGDRIRVIGLRKPFREAQEDAQRLAGRVALIEPTSVTVVKRASFPWRIAGAWRRSFMTFVHGSVSPSNAALLDAVCFNATWFIDDDDWEVLRRTGTVHIISASGLHVHLLSLALGFFLFRLPIPRFATVSIMMLVLILFAIAAGSQAAILRSVIMASVALLAFFVRREPDWLNLMGLAGLIILMGDPRALFDIGFQLSFTLITGLAMFVPLQISADDSLIQRLPNYVKITWKASLWAAILASPLTAYYFGGVSLISPVANVAVLGMVTLVLWFAMSAHLLSFFLSGLGLLLIHASVGWLQLAQLILDGLSAVPFSYVDTPAFNAYWMWPYYAILMVGFWRFNARAA